MREAANVIDGLKAPGEFAQSVVHSDAAQRPISKTYAKPGQIVFQSRYASHRIQLTDPPVRVSLDGTVTKERGKTAQFRSFVFATDDAEIIERMKKHDNFGLGRDFWLADDMVADFENREYVKFRNSVKASPAMRKRLLEEITGGDFELPELNEKTAPAVQKKR